ncbi:MAG: anthranilate phosphoribosyltransferase [Peptococcaceae bacterium]|nr:anthranilate phosphoribosyltransferase [Peptococcaceae bacterium]
MEIRQAIAQVAGGQSLSELQAEAVMDHIMQGEATPAQIAALLVALRMKQETVEEIAGLARGMRRAALQVELPGMELIDTCGTGGDGAGTFNISTTAAFVAAGAGLRVAKHGNRFASSQCGSADVLEALGINVNLPPAEVAKCIEQVGIGFLFALVHHLAMRHVIGPRREIGMRTVFNLLGPLTNPATASYQVVGVFEPNLTETIAAVLHRLGTRRAMVVHGGDGLDEISITAPTKVSELKHGTIATYQLDPRDYGMQLVSGSEIKGGDALTNAGITRAILTGEQGPRRDIVVLNAAAAIYTGRGNISFSEAITIATQTLDSGAALAKLEAMAKLTTLLGESNHDPRQDCAS